MAACRLCAAATGCDDVPGTLSAGAGYSPSAGKECARGCCSRTRLNPPLFLPPSAAGAGYSLFAGKECARALAKVAVDEKECNDKCAVMLILPFQALGWWQRPQQ